ncbi:uncharacterized protein PG986_012590 [Apiospora aurea]|uniref:Mid2 domain-containing protein n=1 Tax=Apiospora aurea TaxID=335848 RepID=A0ABR1Q128_9PEZI
MRLNAAIFGLVAWLGEAAASTTTTNTPPSLVSDSTATTKPTTSVSPNTHVKFWYNWSQQTPRVFVAPPGQRPQPQLDDDEPGGAGSVTIIPSSYRDLAGLGKRLYLSLEWYDSIAQTKGSSFTSLFAASELAPGQPGTESLTELLAELAKTDQNVPYQPEGPMNSTPLDATSASTNTVVQSSPTPTSDNGADLTEGQQSGGGGGGLNPGAIAGIVVGSVIGALLIIGALAYFLCFRRRAGGKQQRRHIHGDVGYASDSGAAAMMMREKEMPGVNHSTPHSAYADDGGRMHERGGVGQDNDSISYSLNTPVYQEERGMAAAGISTQQRQSRDNSLHRNEYNRPQSYAADSAIGVAVSGGAAPNNTAAERERNGSVGGAAVGRASHQTSRPGSEVRSPSRYAHLIEEGMTEDEVRRLEDEERQLDAAIEDAGRHGRPK